MLSSLRIHRYETPVRYVIRYFRGDSAVRTGNQSQPSARRDATFVKMKCPVLLLLLAQRHVSRQFASFISRRFVPLSALTIAPSCPNQFPKFGAEPTSSAERIGNRSAAFVQGPEVLSQTVGLLFLHFFFSSKKH